MDRTWDQLVIEGQRAVKQEGDAKWRLGDLALEVASMGDRRGPNDGANGRLQEYAEEIGIPYETLRDYRRVAVAWELGERSPNHTWATHEVLIGRKDLLAQVEPGRGEVNRARRLVGQVGDRRLVPERMTLDQVIEVVTGDEETAVAIFSHPKVRHMEAMVEPRIQRERTERMDRELKERFGAETSAGIAYGQAVGRLGAATHKVNEATYFIRRDRRDMSDNEVQLLQGWVVQLEAAVAECRAVLWLEVDAIERMLEEGGQR